MTNNEFTHKNGMVDISDKDVTKRTAVAFGKITLSDSAFEKLVSEKSPKGNVLETAKIAGIMGAKQTPSIIPMCHPLLLNKVKVDFVLSKEDSSVKVTAQVVCKGKTGVEMEALTAVSTACLTIYDMMKWADKGMIISDVKLLEKTGGKSGDYKF
ncbi:Cyclic pyranopterin monophosphate synthase accessory protein [hydrothermal vent metagenome]|uniref:cyclic pyranopterin monophosphate synthase n=1 Tax=hydrothermal vent metagenome TaxID=652676 RepID=A0A3B0T1F2_9ZZZZ